jgi:U4/U6.U5 tri-snRNP-associated protein 1
MSEVIECSVEETNRLRAQLGLAPLRTPSNAPLKEQEEECLELSFEATNVLRRKLGLAPLKHATPPPIYNRDAEKIEQVIPLKEENKHENLVSFAATSLGEAEEVKGDARSWAERMKNRALAVAIDDVRSSKDKPTDEPVYSETDLQGLHVGHALHELPEGSTTVLTLADAPLLQKDALVPTKVLGLNDDAVVALENVHLAQEQQRQHGLREKRNVELGLAGAALDDDEFEELGGTQGPSRAARSVGMAKLASEPSQPRRGFQIGAMLEEQDDALQSAMGRWGSHKAISLQPAVADVTASDFMTVEEYERETEKRAKKEKKPKKDRKLKKSKRRRRSESEDEEEEVDKAPATASADNLLAELEATAVGSKLLKRRDTEEVAPNLTATTDQATALETLGSKRARYDQVMSKGNERSQNVFAPAPKAPTKDIDEEPDDAFLNAALEKARRFNRLKALAPPRGAESVAAALQLAPRSMVPIEGGGTVPFAIDETREFTRALFARAEQTERELARRQKREDASREAPSVETPKVAIKEEDPTEDDANLQELSKQVQVAEEDLSGFDGRTVAMGRGVGAMLQLLQQSGELQRKHAGKEEMRGRAKDERTYEDYEPLDLSKVVRIDERNATNKDKELAHREVKLEYRDEHGRLLTRKEAFRELSYQFHGYGSGKRKQEKKLEQIAREQAEARLASRQVGDGAAAGIFGALKEAQKATGKAFVVHKTGL